MWSNNPDNYFKTTYTAFMYSTMDEKNIILSAPKFNINKVYGGKIEGICGNKNTLLHLLLKTSESKGTYKNELCRKTIVESQQYVREPIKLLLSQSSLIINKADSHGHTPLILAILRCSNEVLDWILAHPAIDVNKPSKYIPYNWPGGVYENWTPLLFACRLGNIYAVKQLIERPEIDLHYTDYLGRSALYIAIQYKHNDIADLLFAIPGVSLSQTLSNHDIDYKLYKKYTLHTLTIPSDTFEVCGFGEVCYQHIEISDGTQEHTIEQGVCNVCKDTFKKYIINSIVYHQEVSGGNVEKIKLFFRILDGPIYRYPIGFSNAVRIYFLSEAYNQINLTGVNANGGECGLVQATKNGHTEIVNVLLNRPEIDVNNADAYVDEDDRDVLMTFQK